MFSRFFAAATAAIVLGASASASAAMFASRVVSYTPGDIPPAYQEPATALGKPSPQMDWDYVLTPFNAHWEPGEIVGIGPGGSLTLELPAVVPAGPGRTIGVHAAVGLEDINWPAGQNASPARMYTAERSAAVLVSSDGEAWFSLGQITFDVPTNYYTEGITMPGGQTTPGTAEADFGKPFVGALGDFDGLDWPGTLALLDGSAGGTWLDTSATGLSSVQFIQFNVGTGQVMYVDAVAAVPEPATAMLLPAAMLTMRRRRK